MPIIRLPDDGLIWTERETERVGERKFDRRDGTVPLRDKGRLTDLPIELDGRPALLGGFLKFELSKTLFLSVMNN